MKAGDKITLRWVVSVNEWFRGESSKIPGTDFDFPAGRTTHISLKYSDGKYSYPIVTHWLDGAVKRDMKLPLKRGEVLDIQFDVLDVFTKPEFFADKEIVTLRIVGCEGKGEFMMLRKDVEMALRNQEAKE